MEFKVLGPGCAKCKKTADLINDVIKETGADATLEKVTDLMKIAGYGVFGTPAVIIDEEVKTVGKIPTRETVIKWIEEGGKK